MTIYCSQCKSILNKHTPKFCPECGTDTRTMVQELTEPRKEYDTMTEPLIQAGVDTVQQFRDRARKEEPWQPTGDPAPWPPLSLAERDLSQRLTAAELAIKALQDKADCPESTPPQAGFTPEQMVDAIDQWLEFGKDVAGRGTGAPYFTTGWAAQALRAAKELLLATNPSD